MLSLPKKTWMPDINIASGGGGKYVIFTSYCLYVPRVLARVVEFLLVVCPGECSIVTCNCAVPENIHTTPSKGIGISWRVGGSVIWQKNLKKFTRLYLNFLMDGGQGGLEKSLSLGRCGHFVELQISIKNQLQSISKTTSWNSTYLPTGMLRCFWRCSAMALV